jgi:SAM-dependent methyltransferase
VNYFEQLEALHQVQGGYFYPWRSRLGEGDGESAYTALVEVHLGPDVTVLDAGCGHGSDMLLFAPRVRRFYGYDAVASFVEAARRRAAEAGLANVELIHANSSARFNGGAARIPVADHSLDLIISRRGPGNWIADARRACRPGARLIQLNPLPSPMPAWHDDLPVSLARAENPANPSHPNLPAEVQADLAAAGLTPAGAWIIDVAEVFDEPDELWRALTFMRFEDGVMTIEEARPLLRRVLDHAGGSVDLRQRRYLWTAIVP